MNLPRLLFENPEDELFHTRQDKEGTIDSNALSLSTAKPSGKTHQDRPLNITTLLNSPQLNTKKKQKKRHLNLELSMLKSLFCPLGNQGRQVTAIDLSSLACGCPLADAAEGVISYIISEWKLADNFMYCVEYRGSSTDEAASYYYYEAIFSQPTPAYPVPQVTVSVFFRVRQSHLEPPSANEAPTMTWRLEGHRQDHDVTLELLTEPRLLRVMMMKRNLFQRVEELGCF